MKRIFALLLVHISGSLPAFAPEQYKVVNTVKLGGEGGWDYLYYDKDGERLFITRGSHVMVVDAKTLKVTGDIPDLSGIQGSRWLRRWTAASLATAGITPLPFST